MIKNSVNLKNISRKHILHFKREGYLYIKKAYSKKDLRYL